MSDELRLNLTELNGLWVDLLHVSIAFGQIEYADNALQGAVGGDGHIHGQHLLADRVGDFNTGWDDRRVRIIESLDTIWHSLQAIESTFRKVDSGLAAALDGGK